MSWLDSASPAVTQHLSLSVCQSVSLYKGLDGSDNGV